MIHPTRFKRATRRLWIVQGGRGVSGGVYLPGRSELVFDCAVACPTQTYGRLGHENKTKLKHHVAIHISRTVFVHYDGAPSESSIQGARRASRVGDGRTKTTGPPFVGRLLLSMMLDDDGGDGGDDAAGGAFIVTADRRPGENVRTDALCSRLDIRRGPRSANDTIRW